MQKSRRSCPMIHYRSSCILFLMYDQNMNDVVSIMMGGEKNDSQMEDSFDVVREMMAKSDGEKAVSKAKRAGEENQIYE